MIHLLSPEFGKRTYATFQANESQPDPKTLDIFVCVI